MIRKSLTIYGLLWALLTHAQFPSSDPQFYVKWSDEFNYNQSGNATKSQQLSYLNLRWNTTIKNENTISNYADHFTDGPNIEVSGGTLKMSLTKRTTPITYIKTTDCVGSPLASPDTVERWYDSDWIVTHPEVWEDNEMNYGFYEMRFKIPEPWNVNGYSKNEGIGFGWWMFQGNQPAYSPDVCWTELDFIELSGKYLRFTHNYHFGYTAEGYCGTNNGGWPLHVQNQVDFSKINNLDGPPTPEAYADFRMAEDPFNTPDIEGFHIMSCEVTPEKITWYMDGKYLQSTTGSWDEIETLPDIPYMYMELGIASHEGFNADLIPSNNLPCGDPPTVHTQFPYTVEMDYIRYYKFHCLDAQDRIENPSTGTVYPESDLESGVFRAIAIMNYPSGGARISTSDSNPDNDNVTLRAVEEIELLPGFEVEIGGELYADVHSCGL